MQTRLISTKNTGLATKTIHRNRHRAVRACCAIAALAMSTFAFAANESNSTRNARVSYSSLGSFFLGELVPNASSLLTRSSKGVSVALSTTGLEPLAAHTLWFVVFNQPAACSDGCGADDFGNPAVNASVFWGAGRVSDEFGQADFASNVIKRAGTPGQLLFGPGLVKFNAEIHFVVRSHGPADDLIAADELEDALTTHAGGCVTNVCEDVQFSIHLP